MTDISKSSGVVWPTEQLGILCDITIGRTPSRNRPEFWGGEHAWLSIADMNQGTHIHTTKEKISTLGVKESGSRLIPKGTVLLSFKLSIGKVAVSGIDTYTNEAIAALPILKPKLLSRDYLFWALRSIRLEEEVDAAAKGKTLNKSKLERLAIPLPPLDEQKRIAAVLDRADALRRQRLESLQLTEKLLRSVFLVMFGDPVKNTKRLPTEELHNLAKLERGKFTPRPRNDPSYYSGVYPFIQTGDISRSGGRITEWTQTLNEKGASVSKRFATGTVVIAIVGATLGETAIVETPVYCPDSIIGITPHKNKATPEFIEFLLRLWKPRLKQLAPDAARANLNLERLRPLPALAPPIGEQQQFSRIAVLLRTLVLEKQQTKVALDQLFFSIQQRAFKGELDLRGLARDSADDFLPTSATEKPAIRIVNPNVTTLTLQVPEAVTFVLNELDSTVSKGDQIPWSADYFKFRVLGVQPVPFSFGEIMQKADSIFDEPPYEEIKDMILDLLGRGGGPAVLSQSFDLHIDENTKETSGRKEIVFGPAA